MDKLNPDTMIILKVALVTYSRLKFKFNTWHEINGVLVVLEPWFKFKVVPKFS